MLGFAQLVDIYHALVDQVVTLDHATHESALSLLNGKVCTLLTT